MARESLRLRFYTSLGPGPGFFPFWLAVLLGALAAVMLCRATFGQSGPMPADFFASKVGYLRMGAVVVALTGTVWLLNPLGFRLTMLAAFVFLLLALGRPNWIVTALVSLGGSFGIYHVFVKWLKVPLPTGVFGL